MGNQKLLELARASLELLVELSRVAAEAHNSGYPEAEKLARWTGVQYFAFAAIGREVVDGMNFPEGHSWEKDLIKERVFWSVMMGSMHGGIDAASQPSRQVYVHEICSGALEALRQLQPEDLKED